MNLGLSQAISRLSGGDVSTKEVSNVIWKYYFHLREPYGALFLINGQAFVACAKNATTYEPSTRVDVETIINKAQWRDSQ